MPQPAIGAVIVQAPNPNIPPLVRQLVEWAAARPRTYEEAMEAWRSSCPRLTVWEDALAARLIRVQPARAGRLADGRVRLTAKGRAALRSLP